MNVRYSIIFSVLLVASSAIVPARGNELSGSAQSLPGDLYPDGQINVLDIQRAINQSLTLNGWTPEADLNEDGAVTRDDVGLLIDSAFAAGGVIQLVRGELAPSGSQLRSAFRVEAASLDGLRAESESDERGRFELALWSGRGWMLSVLDRSSGSVVGILQFSYSEQSAFTLPLPARVSGPALDLGRIALPGSQPAVIRLDLAAMTAALVPPHPDEAAGTLGLPRYAELLLQPLFEFLEATPDDPSSALDETALAEQIGICLRAGAETFPRPSLADLNGDGRPDCLERVLECAREAVTAAQAEDTEAPAALTEAAVDSTGETVSSEAATAEIEASETEGETSSNTTTNESSDEASSSSAPTKTASVEVALARCGAVLPEVLAELTHPALVDRNRDGIPDELEAGLLWDGQPMPAMAQALQDWDEDGILNMNDPVWIAEEAACRDCPWNQDGDGDGNPDPADWDDDGDGLPDFLEDMDGDGAINILDFGNTPGWDQDSDGICSALDLDDDNDGQPDFAATPPTSLAATSVGVSRPLVQPVLGLEPPAASPGAAPVFLEIGTPERLGEGWAVPILLPKTMANTVASIQFSFAVDATVGRFIEVQTGLAAQQAGKQLYYLSSPRRTRVLLSGESQTLFKEGIVATVLLSAGTVDPSEESIRLGEVLASSLQGEPVAARPAKSIASEDPAPSEDAVDPGEATGPENTAGQSQDKPSAVEQDASSNVPKKEGRPESQWGSAYPDEEWQEETLASTPQPAIRNGGDPVFSSSNGLFQSTNRSSEPVASSPLDTATRHEAEPAPIQNQRGMIQAREGLLRSASHSAKAGLKEIAGSAPKGRASETTQVRAGTRLDRAAARGGKESEDAVRAGIPAAPETPIQVARLAAEPGQPQAPMGTDLSFRDAAPEQAGSTIVSLVRRLVSSQEAVGYGILLAAGFLLIAFREPLLRALNLRNVRLTASIDPEP